MKLNEGGYKLIADFEGLRLSPYLCSAKVPTIGYGSTFYPSGIKVTMNDKPITQATALWMLKHTADKFAVEVDKLVRPTLTQNQFNALVSFAFNVGTSALGRSTLLRKVNLNPNDPTITAEFAKWNKAGGVVNRGLSRRRAAEAKLYFS